MAVTVKNGQILVDDQPIGPTNQARQLLQVQGSQVLYKGQTVATLSEVAEVLRPSVIQHLNSRFQKIRSSPYFNKPSSARTNASTKKSTG